MNTVTRSINKWILPLSIILLCPTTQALSPLRLTASAPLNNASNGERAGTIALLSFSAALNATTVSTNHVVLRNATTVVPIAVSSTTNELFVTSNQELLPATTYILSISGVQGSNGELLSSPISLTFRTSDNVWRTAQQVENSGQYINTSRLAINKQDGTALAIWSQQIDASHIDLWASRYTTTQQWDTPQPVNNEPGGEVLDSAIAMGRNGSGVAVWEEYYNNGYNNSSVHFRVWANEYTAGIGWATPQLIDTETSQGSMSPQVAIAPDGNATAVWYQYVGGTGRIFSNQYIPASGWGTATAIDAISGAPGSFNPQIAFDNNGYGYAVWEQWWHGAILVWANRYTPDRGWIAPQIIQSDKTSFSDEVQLAFDGNGNAIAIWEESGALFTARYIRDRGWDTAMPVNNDGNATAPGIAINNRGDAFITWTQVVPTGTDAHGITHTRGIILGRGYTIAGGWEATTFLQSTTGFSSDQASIAIDEAGNAIAAWSEYNGTFNRIYTTRYQVGYGWLGRKVIDTSNTTGAFNPHVGIDNKGNGVAIWEQTDTTGTPSIWANQFR